MTGTTPHSPEASFPPPAQRDAGLQEHHAAPQYLGQYSGLPAVAPKTNTLAIISFVSAFFVSLVAIITGHVALAQIRARREAGRGFAIAGLVLGYLGAATVALGIVLVVAFAATVGAFFAASGSGSDGSVASRELPPNGTGLTLPQGRLGAAYFDEGYLEVGAGPVVVDVFLDPLCPYCKIFDDTNGQHLALAVDHDAITLRLHPLTFLDRASRGTDYSTRAAAALTCEAAANPGTTLDYLAALYANQPAENSSGLTDAELIELSTGTVNIADCVMAGDYRLWSQVNTEAASAGALSSFPAIEGTPTVFVDGLIYSGAIDDPAPFSEFVASAF